MEQTLEYARRADLLPENILLLWVVVIFALAVLIWGAARYYTHKYEAKLPLYGLLAPRFVTAVVAAWAGFQLLGRFIEYECRWPIWFAALATGLSVEITAAFYQRERRVISNRLGLTLVGLRSLVIVLMALLIMQPVFVRPKARHFERRVAVVLDESNSMQFVDDLWTVSEKLAWGREFGHVSSSASPLQSLSKLAALHAQLQPWATSATDGFSDREGRLAALLEGGLESARAIHAELETCVKELTPPANGALKPQRDVIEGMTRLVWTQVLPSLDAAIREVRQGSGNPQLIKVADALKQFTDALPGVRLAADEAFWSALDEGARSAVDTLCTTTRVMLARELLTGSNRKSGAVFLDRLASRYDVDFFRMGQTLQRIPRLSEKSVQWDFDAGSTNRLAVLASNETATAEAGLSADFFAVEKKLPQTGVEIQWNLMDASSQAFRMVTDFTSALEMLLKEISSERFAGVIILTDGLHNGPASFDPIARRMGAQHVPVMGVPIGGSRQPFDIAVADVLAPESIFLGDNVRVRTVVRAMHAKGRKLNVQLLFEGTNVVDSAEVEVTDNNWQRELRFKHQPDAQGIVRYDIRTDVLENELFDDNNTWSVDVAVSDDRTNVLLIDDVPRWEFRYLRNLFFGRDKSVHLQYYLVHPDAINDTSHESPLPPASATHKFGEAEAGALPISREEWRKFDVIILGDLPPDVLTDEVMADINHCVAERGALLVTIAGPQAMPHAFLENSILHKMLPVKLDPSHLSYSDSPDPDGYTLALSPAGKVHPVMQQSASYAENESIWQQMPDFQWRIPLWEVKAGAEALAYAVSQSDPLQFRQRFSLENAAEQLGETMRRQTRNALIVASGHGRGKVLSLMFDRTRRFRYRVGDTYHHRFWGQVMRWGVGEKLRSGTEFFRVGTDQVVYLPGAPVQIMGRVLNADGTFAPGITLEALVTRDDGTTLGRQRLNYREDSNGLYEAEFKGIDTPGRYTVRLMRRDNSDIVETKFLVSPTRRPLELADVAANPDDLARLSRWTGGRVVGPDEIDQLLEAFGEGRRTVHERMKQPLWDTWPLFLLIVTLLTAEWLLRKKGNLV